VIVTGTFLQQPWKKLEKLLEEEEEKDLKKSDPGREVHMGLFVSIGLKRGKRNEETYQFGGKKQGAR